MGILVGNVVAVGNLVAAGWACEADSGARLTRTNTRIAIKNTNRTAATIIHPLVPILDEAGRGLVTTKVGACVVRNSSGTITDVLQYGHLMVVVSSPGESSEAPQFGQSKDCVAISVGPISQKKRIILVFFIAIIPSIHLLVLFYTS